MTAQSTQPGLRASLGLGSADASACDTVTWTATLSPQEAAAATPREIPRELIARLKQRVHNLQMLPAVAVQALDLAKDPDCPIGKFSQVIERDIKLAADFLKMANSALFCGGSAVGSLHQAVVRLGMRQARGLILTSSFDSLNCQLGVQEQATRDTLARHGFLTAIIALRLNHLLRVGFQGEEFTAGLMHDLGRTLFAVAVPEVFHKIDPLDFNEPSALEDHERQVIGASHAEFGAWFAAENQLPESLVAAIRFHHQPRHAGDHRRLAAVTAAADHLASHLQQSGAPEDYIPESNVAVGLLEKLGVFDARERFAAAAAVLVNECPRVADAMLRR